MKRLLSRIPRRLVPAIQMSIELNVDGSAAETGGKYEEVWGSSKCCSRVELGLPVIPWWITSASHSGVTTLELSRESTQEGVRVSS